MKLNHLNLTVTDVSETQRLSHASFQKKKVSMASVTAKESVTPAAKIASQKRALPPV